MKTKKIRSAIPIYIAAAIWILYGMALPLYKLSHILLALGLSVVAYLVGERFFPGRVVEADLASGNAQVDQELKGNMADLEKLKLANAGIPSKTVTTQLDRMVTSGRAILAAVAEKPARATQVRKFMKYYLPTTAKLLEQYQTMSAVGAKGEHITKAMSSVENSLGLIASAFEKQLDQLYKDDAVDMTSDVQVLETMMAGDGLTEEGIRQAMKEDTKQCQTSSN
ncbi:MAG: 5-bromo-4-chloroindolyl phosphate hydrolysis family protein [Clostridia bacterium]